MTTVHSRPQRFANAWRVALPLGVLLMAGLIVIGITGFFRLSGDARCLRNSLTEAGARSPAKWHKKLELHVGAITCYLTRTGLSYLHMPEEARAALSAVRGAEVGIYELGADAPPLEHGSLLAAADEVMSHRGWERLVGVARDEEMVAVYVPKAQNTVSQVQTCVAVLQRQQLVVVGARSNLEPLLVLARSRTGWAQPGWASVRL